MIDRWLGVWAVLLAAAGLFFGGCAATPQDGPTDVLRVGVAPTGPPLIYKEGFELKGLEVDMARRLAQALDKRPQFKQYEFADLIKALRRGEIDIIMAGMSVTPARSRRIAFASPYLTVGQMALCRADERDQFSTTGSILLTRGRVGAEKGTTGQLFVLQSFPYAEKLQYNSTAAAVGALKLGSIDLVITDGPYAYWFAKQDAPQIVIPTYTTFTSEFLAWGVNKNNTALLDEVNRVLAEWRQSGALDDMVDQWMQKIE